MMKRVLILLLVAGCSSVAFAQQRMSPPKVATLPSSCNVGDLVNLTTGTVGDYVCIAANTWASTPLSGGSAGPTDATYITQIPNATLSAEQAMSALATGIVKNTTTTGVQSIAVAGTDYQAPITGTDTDVCFYDGTGVACNNAGLKYAKTTGILSVGNTAAAGNRVAWFGNGILTGGVFTISSANDMQSRSGALTVTVTDDGGANSGTYYGASLNTVSAHTTPSGTLDNLYGLSLVTNGTEGGGTVTDQTGVRIAFGSGSSGTATSTYGVHILSPANNGATLTTVYGLNIDNLTTGATNYAIKTGTGLVSFGDDVQIANGKAFAKPDTTTAHTALLQAYDTDTGPAYVTCGTLTNGNSPSFALSNATGCAISITGASLVTPALGVATATSVTGRFITSGSAPTVDDTSGGNSCGAAGNPSMNGGNDNAFEFNVGAGGGTDCTVTLTAAAPNRWDCHANNETSAVLTRTVYVDTTHIKVQGVLGAADVISVMCFAR